MRAVLKFITCLLFAAACCHAANENASRALAGADLVVGTLKDAANNKLDFSGNKTFTVEQLRAPIAEQIRELQEKGITPVRADDTAFYVGAFYRKSGFAQATVEYQIRGDRLLLTIVEGPRALRSISEASLLPKFMLLKASGSATMVMFLPGKPAWTISAATAWARARASFSLKALSPSLSVCPIRQMA